MKAELVVVDTNVLISARLIADSAPAQALEALRACGARLLFSGATLAELDTRLRKPKFRRYVTEQEIAAFLDALADIAVLREPEFAVNACRDPDDNAFLALALDGQADCIITGDQDLLVLHPFEGMPIFSPAEFLAVDSP